VIAGLKCAWCGIRDAKVNHHVSYNPEILVSICKGCHVMWHKRRCVPCRGCSKLGKIKYHLIVHKGCVVCDPVRREKANIIDMIFKCNE